MKKNYSKLLLLLLGLLSAPALKAQMYTAGDITAMAMPSMSHDSTTCSSTCALSFLITITSSFTGDSVKIVDLGSASLLFADGNTSGATTWTVPAFVPIFNPIVTDDQVVSGSVTFIGPNIKIISGTDTIPFIPNIYTLPVSNPCLYGSVSGKVYIDNNSDCAFNSGDVPLNAIQVSSVASLSGPSLSSITANTSTGSAGTYNMTVQQSWMTSYNVSVPPAYYFIFPITSCFSGAYTYTTLPQVNVDFPLQCTGNVDVQSWAGSPGDVRVGTPFYMHPYVSNTGCDSATGWMTFIKDSRVSYNAGLSTNPAVVVSGDTLKWNYTNLTNLTGGAYWNSFMSSIHLTPDTSVHVGDTLCFRIYSDIPTGDINTANNSSTICLPVVYSYDPNLKEVSPKGTGATGNIPVTTATLNYTLHFQNTGSSYAMNVEIIDTLDSHLDPATLKIEGASHIMQPEWIAPGVVKFKFPGIYLPDSTSNEAASHGFVRFRINLDAGLPTGTQIRNKGYIYFDTNPAVITNTTVNTLSTVPGGIAHVSGSDLLIYPNPATDKLFIDYMNNGRIMISAIDGAIILEQSITGNGSVDVSTLPAGIYILKAVSDNITKTTKFIKQ